MERARKAYVAADGTTKVTLNLRHAEADGEQPGPRTPCIRRLA